MPVQTRQAWTEKEPDDVRTHHALHADHDSNDGSMGNTGQKQAANHRLSRSLILRDLDPQQAYLLR